MQLSLVALVIVPCEYTVMQTLYYFDRSMTAENVIFMECQKMNCDPKQFSSELVKSLKSRKIKKENPGPAQETRIESEWKIEPEEEVLAELIVPVHQCPVVNIHASMMNPTGQIISEGKLCLQISQKNKQNFVEYFCPSL